MVNLFNPSPKTPRTPVKSPNNSAFVIVNPMIESEAEHLARKRKIGEVNKVEGMSNDVNQVDANDLLLPIDNDDVSKQLQSIFALILSTSRKHSEEIASLKTDLTQKIQDISERVNLVESDISNLQSQVKSIDNKFGSVSKATQLNNKLINNMMQENLIKCMDIDGIDNNTIESTNDLKKLATDVINSYNIAIDSEEIERVSKKQIKKEEDSIAKSRTILMVHFKEFEAKLRVMRSKKDIKDNKIFFNASLTPLNKYFLMNAKKSARNAGLKVFFTSGKVHVEKPDKQIITIQSDKDLDDLKMFVDEIKSKNPKQPSTSGNNK